ncbi:hypothetical protein GcC1_155026 [Golovinomyces cichoracearum]|uniref:Retrotransposon gag domain-containing protein n=1 Tax=Golovinomyces cichoracearum TaxID=62708 RepID=A0A420HVZ2_9PEZI|nr:hypothetical protein GcC1_155026 [Golovinomyces cichoracearum]
MSGIDINHPTIQKAIQDAVQRALSQIQLSPSSEAREPETKSFLRQKTPSLAPHAPSPISTDFSSSRDIRDRTRFQEKFADNKSEVDFEAWKMEMKIMIDDHPLEFNSTEKQIRAYFKCTTGRAQKLLLSRMSGSESFKDASEVVQALDEEFFDYNKETRAREGNYNLRMQNSETYRCFRMKFRELAMEGGMSRAYWFNDLCNKITPALRRDIKGEKF